MTEIWKERPSRAALIGLTLLRMIVGVIFIAHGWQKLTGFAEWQSNVAGMGLPMDTVLAGLAVAGELGGGIGLVLGLLTRVAAFGTLCVMLTAIATVHLQHGLLMENGGFEYPLLLAVTSLFFILRGAGPVSVDAMWTKERAEVERHRLRPTSEQPAGERPSRSTDRAA